MGLSMEDIYNMTVADRHDFIAIHNREVEKENKELEQMSRR